MAEMSSYERMKRMYEHRQPDRVPFLDSPWGTTIRRWQREGMPAGVSWVDYFGVDRLGGVGVDTSPGFAHRVIEETDEYIIEYNSWGVTTRNFKLTTSTPQDIDFTIRDRQSWAAAKERLLPTDSRINWDHLRKHYAAMREHQLWISAGAWFGYDIVNARMVGTETLLMAMADDPEWVRDMLDTLCELALTLFNRVWEAGYTFDEIRWPDDMGYRNGLLFSKRMWDEMVRPYQQRTIDWAHAKGIKAHMHSCGNIMELVPELVDLGLDALNPLEVKAGMDPLGLKQRHGDRLALQGGFDARNWSSWDAAEAEIRAKLPVLMENGGYIFASDHSIPDAVSLDTMQRIVALVKELGRY
ncbi:MAG: uroporphyrinogen decarboxylase family protein [Candidatus Latescibacterota bacterium]